MESCGHSLEVNVKLMSIVVPRYRRQGGNSHPSTLNCTSDPTEPERTVIQYNDGNNIILSIPDTFIILNTRKVIRLLSEGSTHISITL